MLIEGEVLRRDGIFPLKDIYIGRKANQIPLGNYVSIHLVLSS